MSNIYLSIEMRKLKEGFVNVLNSSNLPVCVKQMVLNEIVSAVDEAALEEYQNDLAKAEAEEQGDLAKAEAEEQDEEE